MATSHKCGTAFTTVLDLDVMYEVVDGGYQHDLIQACVILATRVDTFKSHKLA